MLHVYTFGRKFKSLYRKCVKSIWKDLCGHCRGMHLPGCLSGLQLQLSTVTGDPRNNLFHRPLPGGLRENNTISLNFFRYTNPLHNSQFASLIRFKRLPDSSEIVLEAEKSPRPEMQPHFSFWTFGHLFSPCGALRWLPLSYGEAPKITKEWGKYVNKAPWLYIFREKKYTYVSVFPFIFEFAQTCSVLRHL